MIISHEHRFIFIKNRKVGGTSVEEALAPICGPDDVLTPDGARRPGFVSPKDPFRETARNFHEPWSPAREFLAADGPMSLARTARDYFKRSKFYNHMPAHSVRARVPREIWDSYYKFCIERNSWDKMISFYYFAMRRREPTVDLDTFILKGAPGHSTEDQRFPTDWFRYAHRGRVIVDEVVRYEDLEGGLQRALANAGVPEAVRARVALTQSKTHLRKQREAVVSPAALATIERVFAREIAHFGFERPAFVQPRDAGAERAAKATA